jgi:hypothetical protein
VRTTAAVGVLGLLAAAGAFAPSAHAQSPAPGAANPALTAIGGDVATLADNVSYRLSPQLAALLGKPVGAVLDAAGARALSTAATPVRAGSATPPVGTTLLWPALDASKTAGPVGIYLKPYTLRAVGNKVEVWVASGTDAVSSGTGFPAGDPRDAVPHSTDITDARVRYLVHEFDSRIYPRETKAFSTPLERTGTQTVPGLTAAGLNFAGAGDHTVTLVDNVRDDNFYDVRANPTYIAGFFSPIFNQLTDRNVMTIDAFDWLHRTGAHPKDDPNADPALSRPAHPFTYEGVFAHEWQHLLQSYQDPGETTWMNEGLSDYAMSLVGYADTRRRYDQPGAQSHLACFEGYGTVRTPANPNPHACGGPQNSLTAWEDEGSGAEVLADYGNAWSFLLYLSDRYGQGFIRSLHRDGDHQGLASVQHALDVSAPGTKVADVLHDYQLMNLLDHDVDTAGGVVHGIDKAKVTTSSLDASLNLTNPASFSAAGVAPNGADYLDLSHGARSLRSLDFTGTGTAAWHVSLVGIDAAKHRALVSSTADGASARFSSKQLHAFHSYPTVVAVVSHDEPNDLADPKAAGYSLNDNGTQRGR